VHQGSAPGAPKEEPIKKSHIKKRERLPLSFPSGVHRGETLQQVLKTDPGYLRWVADNWGSDVIRGAARHILGDLGEPGRWTQAELETARAESLAETPIDVDEYLGEYLGATS